MIERVVFNRWKNSVREMCGDTCCGQRVATHVCGKCAGRCVVFQKVAKNVCNKCARDNCSDQKVAAKRVLEICGETAVFKR